MIHFFAGFATGAVTALFSAFCLHKRRVKAQAPTALSPEQERLNAERKAHMELLQDRDRQFEKMMNYTGKEQRA